MTPEYRDTVETLHKAKAILNNNGWCKRAAARNSAGDPVDVDHWDAHSFCLTGAIGKALGVKMCNVNYGEFANDRRYQLLEIIHGRLYEQMDNLIGADHEIDDVETFNDLDETKFSEVMQLIDMTIRSEMTHV